MPKKNRVALELAVAIVVAAGTLSSVAAQCELHKLNPSSAGAEDLFGNVSMSGDVVAVGVSLSDSNVQDSGSVYVFRRDGDFWDEEQHLTPDDPATNLNFGASTSISGCTLAVGAPGAADFGSSSGAVYIYRYDGNSWFPEQRIVPSDSQQGDAFGLAVSVADGLLAVGAWGDDDRGSSSGSVYVFRFNGQIWVEEQKLFASDAEAWDSFGISVAVGNETVAAGAMREDGNCGGFFCEDTGAVYVFRHTGSSWEEEQKIVPVDLFPRDLFGSQVAIENDILVASSPRSDDACGMFGFGCDSGSAYVFRYDGQSWVEEQELLSSDLDERDFFGTAIGVSGDTIVVGAPREDSACPASSSCDSGAAYVFRYANGQWNEEEKITASDQTEDDLFGSSLAVSGNLVVIASPWDDGACPIANCAAGSAYAFALDSGCQGSTVDPPCTLGNLIRGDANGDGNVVGIADGLFTLAFQFVPWSPAPPCLDAADADDSGSVNGLVDGVYILNYAFSPGGTPPPAPGPFNCGSDPTPDSLRCDQHPCP